MKTLRLFLPVFGGLALTIGVTLILFLFSSPDSSVQAGGVIRYVTISGSDAGNDCMNNSSPCRTIHHALNSANTGDTIQIGEGEFKETLLIDKDILLFGAGQGITFINGEGLSSVIQNEINSTSVISGMSLINGHAYEGGGILNQGHLSLDHVILTGNKADVWGGAIKNSGVLSITNSLIFSNTASGGNIYNKGIAYIATSTIKENLALGEGGGILNQSGYYITISQSNIAQNTAKNGGGGIANYGNLTILSSSIISNTSNEGSPVDQGGGIYNSGNLVIENSEISGNSAYEGFAIYQHYYLAPTTLLRNVSILKNHPLPGTIDAETKAGITTIGGDFSLENSMIALNGMKNCKLAVTSQGTSTINSLGNNLSDDATCELTAVGDIENENPQLDNFYTQNLVWFHTLSMDSPAIDQGNDAVCPTLDIREKERPRDGDFDGIAHCDIGAYELILPPLYLVAPPVGQPNTPIELEARVTVLTLTTPITYNWFISEQTPITQSAQYTHSIQPAWSTTGVKVITVEAVGSNGIHLTTSKTIEILYQVFLPTTNKPWEPQAGPWLIAEGFDGYFYVSEDSKNIVTFKVYFNIPNCGQVEIYTTEPIPIVNNSFSFNDYTSYYATGTFDSPTHASGVYGLDHVYIEPCEVYWTIPMTDWTGHPPGTYSQRLYAPYEPDNPPDETLPYKVILLSPSK